MIAVYKGIVNLKLKSLYGFLKVYVLKLHPPCSLPQCREKKRKKGARCEVPRTLFCIVISSLNRGGDGGGIENSHFETALEFPKTLKAVPVIGML